MLAGLRSDRSVKDVCREHEIAETLYYSWRDKLIEGGKLALADRDERASEKELRWRDRAHRASPQRGPAGLLRHEMG